VGPTRAGAICRAAFHEQSFDVAISSGLACALAASSIGDLFVGTDVIAATCGGASTSDAVTCDHDFAAMAMRAARAASLPVQAGRFVSVPRILWRGEQKRRVATETGAIALDMESAAIGAVAGEYRIPFVVIRAASDLLDEDLPLDFNLFLTRTDWLKGAWACVSRPTSLWGLRRMRTQMRTASQRLTMVFQRLFDEVARAETPELRKQVVT
jgi:adenosylhomocysteine nucleosidase